MLTKRHVPTRISFSSIFCHCSIHHRHHFIDFITRLFYIPFTLLLSRVPISHYTGCTVFASTSPTVLQIYIKSLDEFVATAKATYQTIPSRLFLAPPFLAATRVLLPQRNQTPDPNGNIMVKINTTVNEKNIYNVNKYVNDVKNDFHKDRKTGGWKNNTTTAV